MAEVFIPIIISFALLITNIVSVCVAVHYKRKEYAAKTENKLKVNDKLTVFTSRDAMLVHLHSMYTRAKKDEIIWGQSVSGNIYGDVNGKIATAAARGVKFQMIFNSDISKPANAKEELKELFTVLNAEIRLRKDNDIRIQGLSTKEAVVALPTNSSYVAVLVKDEAVVCALRSWFLSRFDSCIGIK